MFSVPIDASMEKRLERLGAQTPSAKAELVKRALAQALEDLEDMRLAEERLSKPARRYSLEEVERDLGLDS